MNACEKVFTVKKLVILEIRGFLKFFSIEFTFLKTKLLGLFSLDLIFKK